MKVSVNTLRGYQQQYRWSGDPAPDSVDALARRIGSQLGAIEEVIDFGSKYGGVMIVKVVSCADHPNADRLHVCKVDDGGRAQNVERDEQGHVQVVCGAPNVRAGMLAAWLPPGVTVPSTFGTEPFVMEAREIRGQKSNGMMASPKELGIGDSHEGILDIDGDIAPGTPFAEQFNLTDDKIFDIENKMFTHRPDCFGLLGVAREIAGIQQQPFKSPVWYRLNPEFPQAETDELKLEIRNEIPELVPRFAAIALRDIKIGPSPVWLQLELTKAGMRPINNVVDLTNYYMLLTAQPLHAYDYDKVIAQDQGADRATIVVRHPRAGEKILLLNGKEVDPRPEAMMIATRDRLIGIGGVMGGGETEVDEHTKNVIIECATFDMYSIRKTSMAHGLFTDAVTRFNKGQSPLQNLAVLAKITEDMRELAGGKVASNVIDVNHIGDRAWVHPPVPVTVEFINSRLGLKLSAEEMKRLLENVEFQVAVDGDNLTVTAPFWRTDIELREDVVEEIGRLYGYDKLPLELPKRDLMPAPKDPLLELKARIRATLSRAGANEALTYSFVHGNLLDKVGQDKNQAFQLSNAISPDLQYYRLSLVPSLLEKVHANIKAGYDEFALFEIGKSHIRGEQDYYEPDVPKEVNALGFVMTSKQPKAGAAYYYARCYLAMLLSRFNVSSLVSIEPLQGADLYKNSWAEQMVAPFEPTRSIVLRGKEGIWGVAGEFKASVRTRLKLPDYSAGFEIDPLILGYGREGASYIALPRFPKVEQDICLKVDAAMPYQEVYDFTVQTVNGLKPQATLAAISPIDIYQREDDRGHRQITLRLSIASYERTLTDKEVAELLDKVAVAAKEKLHAERV